MFQQSSHQFISYDLFIVLSMDLVGYLLYLQEKTLFSKRIFIYQGDIELC